MRIPNSVNRWLRTAPSATCSRHLNAKVIRSGTRSRTENGPVGVELRAAMKSAAAFFCASVILSAGMGGMRSCAQTFTDGQSARMKTMDDNPNRVGYLWTSIMVGSSLRFAVKNEKMLHELARDE